MTTTDGDRLLNPREVATRLGIGARKVWTLTNTGELRCVRIGRSVRYHPDDIAAFIEARRGKRGPGR